MLLPALLLFPLISSFTVTIPPSNVGDLYSIAASAGGDVDVSGGKYTITIPSLSAEDFVNGLTSRTAGAASVVQNNP